MTREGPIVRSALGSSAFHGVLLVAAFSVYDPVELETRDYQEGVRMVLATVQAQPKPKEVVEPEKPPEVAPAPKPKIKRRPRVKPTPRPPEPEPEPETVASPDKAPPKKTQAARKVGLQKIGAKAKTGKTEAPAASVADSSAPATAPSSVTGAAETAAKAKKAAARGLIKTYYGTLSSYLRRNYEYPRRARLAAIEGTVLIEIVVDREGKVLSTRVARSSGHEILDKAALASISKLRTVPAPPDGLAWTRRAIRVPLRYSLKT